ncbi:ATP-binding protein [Entomospira nematocerorum]|uniref:histidine kinase n=1 Tax=Entomospira nematocerorum TaxID=2719987 RepID=A0A968KXE3_9SPIO|nr:ATP-binding protein [Entomospira nematocera]NIZ46487.1 hypothetical protein [Entomospira nematocera]WDI33712.1 ATP-binding protein [Entomospira nematocera]
MRRHLTKALHKSNKLSTETLITLLTATHDELAIVQAVLESLKHGIIVVSEKGDPLVWNQSALRLFQIGDLKQDRPLWKSIYHKELRNYLEISIKAQLLGESEDLRIHNRLICCEITPWVLSGAIAGSLIWIEDVTEKRLQMTRLRQAEAMARLSTMAATLAHEIKNPLGAISIHLQLLKKSIPLTLWTEHMEETFDVLSEEMHRLAEVVHNYLDASRPLSMHLERCDLLSTLRELLDVLSVEALEQKIELNLAKNMGFIPYLLLDKSLIKQAMMNLLQNAMQSGAHIIDLRIYVTAEQVILEIEDDGVGISAENINKIFEPHFTTRKNGNGLGLTIVFKILREHGASIEVESPIINYQEGMHGTRVRVKFMRMDGEYMQLAAPNDVDS